MATRQGTMTGLRRHHAGDTVLRPDCAGLRSVAYGRIALCDNCDNCDTMRSVVGREHTARKLAGAGLDRLARAVENMKDAEQALADAVSSARHGGASWGEIGDIVGTTRQAAHQRWSPKES